MLIIRSVALLFALFHVKQSNKKSRHNFTTGTARNECFGLSMS